MIAGSSEQSMIVLFVASEGLPFLRSGGGLADLVDPAEASGSSSSTSGLYVARYAGSKATAVVMAEPDESQCGGGTAAAFIPRFANGTHLLQWR